MGIDKKVSTKYYLNTNLKPHIDEEGRELYPIYVRVTFNRNNTQFRIHKKGIVIERQSDLDSHPWIQSMDKLIVNIVEFEYGKMGEGYTLKGLNKRLKVYRSNFCSVLEAALFLPLSQSLKKVLSYDKFIEWEALDLVDKITVAVVVLEKADPSVLTPSIMVHTIAVSYLSYYEEYEGMVAIASWLFTDLRSSLKNNLISHKNIEETTFTFGNMQIVDSLSDENISNVFSYMDRMCFALLERTDPNIKFAAKRQVITEFHKVG